MTAFLACRGPNPAFREVDARTEAGIEAPPPVEANTPTPDIDATDAATAEPTDAGDAGAAMDTTALDGAEPSADLAPGPADVAAAPDLVMDVAMDLAPIVSRACETDPSLTLCFRFEGGHDNESPVRHTITARGIVYQDGPAGRAGRFDTGSRLQVAPNRAGLDVSTGFTLEATVFPRITPPTGARFGLIDYTRGYALFVKTNGDVDCIVTTKEGTRTLTSTRLVEAQVWAKIACVASNGQLSLWKNGSRRDGRSIADLEPGSGADTLVVGGNFDDDDPDPFDGLLDDVRVWRRALSPAELAR